MKDFKEIKKDFPFFENNPDIIYFDSAATSHKPKSVIEVINNFYSRFNSNNGRSNYKLAYDLNEKVTNTREVVKDFIGADSAEEVFFTSGSTHSFQKVTNLIGHAILRDGDEILYCEDDHSSFVQPWFDLQSILSKYGVVISLISFKTRLSGGADIEDIKAKLTQKTRVVNVTHIHNVFGADSDINDISALKREYGFILNIDGTQSVGHLPVDVQSMGCDLYSFSGHKMFAAQGVGVLYINKSIHEQINPLVNELNKRNNKSENFKLRDIIESGTQNYAGILSLSEAIKYIKNIGEEEIHRYLTDLTQFALEELRGIEGVEFTKGPNYWRCIDGYGIISFRTTNLSSVELGFILDQHNIYVRTGNHCSINSENDSTRISLHIYNDKSEIKRFLEILKEIL